MSVGDEEVVNVLGEFLKVNYDSEIQELIQNHPDDQRSLYVDWHDIRNFNIDLAHDCREHTEYVIQCVEEALQSYDITEDVSLGDANVRIYNLEERIDLDTIRSRHINQLVEITGTVDSIEQSQSALEEGAFQCQLCGTLTRIPRQDDEVEEPHECQGCERGGPFRLKENQSEFVDRQTIYVEQRPVGAGTDEDREIITVRLEDDLVDDVVPGNTINVCGIVHRDGDLNNSTASIPDKYIKAVGITEAQQYQLDITDEDKERIVRLCNDPSFYEKMVGSIAPTIHGYEQEKLALLLQLFAGVTKQLPDGTRIRGDIHIGMVGDPGVAKSKLARYAARVAPRSVHVSGTTTSKVGLTASAERTSNSNNTWTFEAGALPKAHLGIACVDNITDMRSEELRALHDVLEEQVVEASKGSSTVSIPAQASLLTIGNPKYGRFDEYEPIGGQIDIEPGLLSQFDLLFVINDTPDEKQDERVAEHILQSNYAGQLDKQRSEHISLAVDEEEIEEQIEEVTPEIEPQLLRKFIAYARTNCHPRFTDKAREELKDFYTDVRSAGGDEDQPIPVSARKLEGLIRLSEASARMRLSDTVESSDAERAVDLVRSCLQDIGIDPDTGSFDADIVEAGTSKSQRDQIKKLEDLIQDIEEQYEKGAPIETVLQKAEKYGTPPEKTKHEIDKLKQKGKVYEPNTDYLRTT